jgi:hypothetical protein
MQTETTKEQAAEVEAETTFVVLPGVYGLAVTTAVWRWMGAARYRRGMSFEWRRAAEPDIAVSYADDVPPEVAAADAEFVRTHLAGIAAYLDSFAGPPPASQSQRRMRTESPRRARRRRAGAGRTVEGGDGAASR